MSATVSAPPASVWKALARRLSQPGRARMKVFDPDTKEYRQTRRITDTLPTQMAAVYLYAQRRTTLLALDFDSKVHGRGQVDADVERARGWLQACGARLVTDRSTNGGRHILIPLAIGTTASFDEIQPLLRQLKARLPSLDTTPMQNHSEGCISVPGTPCAGGYRQLDGTLIDAVNALAERSAPTLLPEMYALLGTLPTPPVVAPAAGATSQHTVGTGADERLIERARWVKPMPAEVADFATHGVMKKGRWLSPSEARMSVVVNAVLRGSSLADLRAATRPGGIWSALGASYTNKCGNHAHDRLASDVRIALDYTATLAEKTNPLAHRNNYSQRGVAVEGPIGRWLAYALAWTDHEFNGSPLRWTVRDVLQSLAIKAALAGEIRSGIPIVGVGGRSLSLSAGLLAPTTLFDVLRRIRTMVGSPILLVRPAVGRDADFYALTATNPDNLTAVPLDRIAVRDVHPVWSILGRQHRLIYELISATGLTRPADIYAAARVSARSGQLTITALASAGLLTRNGRTVAVGAVSLDDIAAAHRLHETMDERIDRFRQERAAWHAWLDLQDELRGLTPPPDDNQNAATPATPVFADEQEYLAAVLAQGPPNDYTRDEESAALEILADLLGARVLTAAR